MFGHRLGRKAVKTDSRTLKLAKYLAPSLPSPPPALDWTERFTAPWGEMMNQNLSCCTISALGHALQIWTRNASGIETTVPDSAVLTAYEAWCGYDPADPNTDQGGVELDVLNRFHKDSFAGHKLNAFASVNHANLKEVRTAIKLFGGVYIGVSLPLSAQDQTVWDVVSDPQQAAPGGWGGHAVFIVAYDPGSFTCITWGEKMKMTTAFWNAYVDESFALLSADWINSGGIAPSGLDLTTLTADLGMIR